MGPRPIFFSRVLYVRVGHPPEDSVSLFSGAQPEELFFYRVCGALPEDFFFLFSVPVGYINLTRFFIRVCALDSRALARRSGDLQLGSVLSTSRPFPRFLKSIKFNSNLIVLILSEKLLLIYILLLL